MRQLALVCLAALACRAASPSPSVRAPDVPAPGDRAAEARGDNGMVTSDAPIASQVGVDILRAGGNAVDAAVAVGFTLAVVYPEAGNLGGGGFTLVRMADGRVAAIDYREVAPLAATRTMFLGDSGRTTDASVVGPLASGVPGAVAGMVETHQRFGRLTLAQVLAPAIRLADEGFVVDSQLAASVRESASLIGRFEGRNVFLPAGAPIASGSTLRQPALARTLRAIADSGAVAFYSGGLARVIAEDLRGAGSIITYEDLTRYKVAWREPVRATYRGRTLLTMPPPSSGVTMVQILNILEGFRPLPAFGSTQYAHVLGAAMQRAFVDRNRALADPAFARVPTDRLADKSYAAALRAGIGQRATPTPVVTSKMSDGTETTHYAVVDAEGNAVSTTTTINDLYGSGVYLHNAGFFMNDEMDDFAANPGQPNLFGLVQGEQNAIQPGKRMLSSMIPTIVLDRAGRPFLLVGARGGPRIVTSVTQTIVNVLDHGMSLADAIDAPRLHHQALPDTIGYEPGFRPAVLDSLRGLGYGLREIAGIGSVNGIMRAGSQWVGYADPRSGGRPAGY